MSLQRFHLQRQAAVIHTMRKLLSCCPCCCCCFYLSFLFQNLKPIQKPLEASYYGFLKIFSVISTDSIMCAISWQLSPATAIFLTFVKLIFAQYLIEFQQWAKIFQNNKIQTFHVLAFKTSEIWTISIFTYLSYFTSL